MFKFNNFIIISVSFLSSSLYAADLMDVYNRSLKYNNQLKIISNNNQIAGEQYNQTSSTIFPDISISASSKKIDIEKAIGYTIKDGEHPIVPIMIFLLAVYFSGQNI